MTKALVMAAALGLSVSGVSACEYMKSVRNLDKTTVASVTSDVLPAMSTPDAATPRDTVTTEEPADKEG
ncbi:MAG: hypothetical protein AB7I79_05655 [Rhizobiaceae bacterium]